MKNEKSIFGFNDENNISLLKKRIVTTGGISGIFIIIILLTIFFIAGCKKENISPSNTPPGQTKSLTGIPPATGVYHAGNYYTQVNLVANERSFDPLHVDGNLNNAWGMAIGERGIWVTSNHKGLAVVYNPDGQTLRPPVDIPLHGTPFGSSPDGIVFNNTSGFMILRTGERSKLIFATEDGTIAAWSSGESAVTVADRSASGAVYKGIALGKDGGTYAIYATNFNSGKVDVFNESFRYMKSFTDPSIPEGYAPFNIKLIDGMLYVTYAKQKPDHHDDEAGPGNGYISIFNTDGSFVKRFVSQGPLNSPWGMTEMEGLDKSEKILVGNFGDGMINVFDPSGKFEGQLMGKDGPISIPGLWDILISNNIKDGTIVPLVPDNRLYFTAGPNDENNGLFGYLQQKPPIPDIAQKPEPVISGTVK